MKFVRLILVTGTPRSGTTAVGLNLSMGKGVRTLYEPFSKKAGMVEINNHFEVPGSEIFPYSKLDLCIKKLKCLDLKLKPGIFPKDTGFNKLVKFIVGGRSKFYYRVCKYDPFVHTVIWKDPLACFTSEYVAKFHDIDVIVTCRNPWAVAASFKRLGWSFDLPEIQSRLAEVNPFKIQIPEAKDMINIHPSVLNASVLWYLVNSVLLSWKEQQKIQFVNLDSIIINPVKAYKTIYEKLDLDFNTSIQNKIQKNYNSISDKISPDLNQTHDWNRNVLSVNTYWDKLLSEEEVRLVGQINNDLWQALQAECLYLN